MSCRFCDNNGFIKSSPITFNNPRDIVKKGNFAISCYYCGGSCDEMNPFWNYVSKSCRYGTELCGIDIYTDLGFFVAEVIVDDSKIVVGQFKLLEDAQYEAMKEFWQEYHKRIDRK